MNGHHVSRRFGWDTHGLPIEFEIDKQLGVRTRDQVLEMGIAKYNQACRGIVMRYSAEWEKTVTRLGRWIDFQNDYKTLDPSFMESVWWVFKQLWEKNMVYRGFKVMPYSLACSTPLSNFEAGSNYKDKSDPYILVSFPKLNEQDVELVVMTTTPWTLPSNLALCVHPEFDYVKIKDKESGKKYVLLKKRLCEIYNNPEEGKQYETLETFKGKDMKGWEYVPMFEYFEKEFKPNGAFRVLLDTYVKDDGGTGVVHQAPAFGVDDNRVCMENGVIKKGDRLPLPLDANGRFTAEVPDWKGELVFDANKSIMKNIKDRGRMVKQLQKFHSYPYCWRSETPLIYRGVPCWFIKVEQMTEDLLANQEKTYWVPPRISKRFVNWLKGAVDWAVSRNRFWGTPLPLWVSEDFTEVVCVGSVSELEELSGVRVKDLHRESVDHITIPSKKGNGVLRRVEEVFDCWFESGSMPYAQVHYPFENKEKFQNSFPADFIAEGVDQTRGWFYTLMVLSTALFDKPAFKNLIVNGLVLAADGKKMSKRLKNYPDPVGVIDKYGSDALRLYLINSPVVHADDLRFREEGVSAVLKDVLLPWFHAYRFCVETSLSLKKFVPNLDIVLKSNNVMDRWIMASLQNLVKFVRDEMKAYRLYTVIPKLVSFVEDLTNWYLRSNRGRMKGAAGEEEREVSVNVLFEVLLCLSVVMAPFTPFLAEYFYQNLRKVLPAEPKDDLTATDKDYHYSVPSVHYLPIPTPMEQLIDADVLRSVKLLQQAIELARQMRERNELPLKQPLSSVRVYLHQEEDLKKLELVQAYLMDQVQVKEVKLSCDVSVVKAKVIPDQKRLGARLKKDRKKVVDALMKLSDKEVRAMLESGEMVIEGHQLTSEDVSVKYVFEGGEKGMVAESNDEMVVVLDTVITPPLQQEFFRNQTVNFVQRLRKTAGVRKTDDIEIFFSSQNNKFDQFFEENRGLIQEAVGRPFMNAKNKPDWLVPILSTNGKINRVGVEFQVCGPSWCVALDGLDKSAQFALDMSVGMKNRKHLTEEIKKNNGLLNLKVNGTSYKLERGVSLFPSANARAEKK
uniref:isoleucine--tRNA ligase n=1 Tax=Paramoeba aestuarina TaxID=180227 RepID=A0A7S4NT32_9EUKA